jgi:membrane-bound lytic murein transglycosylase MltF
MMNVSRALQILLPVLAFLILAPSVQVMAADGTTNESGLTELENQNFLDKWTGDLDEMVERRQIRVLVVYSKTFYFLDGAVQRGITHDAMKEFEKYLNKRLKTKTLKVHVVFVPTSRDKLISGLVEGRGDIAAANLTITPGRQELVDFSRPALTNVSEIVVSGHDAPTITTVDDLSGQDIWVRKSSSYYESLVALNESFREKGKPEANLMLAEEFLEDEDLLEMVNAGLIPLVVVDNHKAQFWDQVYENIELHTDVAVRTGGQIAWAFRKNSPKLEALANDFIAKNKKGTLLGNMLLKRYLRNTKWVTSSTSEKELKKFRAIIDFLKEYAERYAFDWLMVGALAYQESRLDQKLRSRAGAVGVMQVLPSTAADPNVSIPNIDKLENNIHAGVKYLRFLRNRYFEGEDMDDFNKHLFSFASYNAGPAKVSRLRKQAAKIGLDPNLWFDNVERIAAKVIGRETVQYVRNIYKYFIAYKLIVDHITIKEATEKNAASN